MSMMSPFIAQMHLLTAMYDWMHYRRTDDSTSKEIAESLWSRSCEKVLQEQGPRQVWFPNQSSR